MSRCELLLIFCCVLISGNSIFSNSITVGYPYYTYGSSEVEGAKWLSDHLLKIETKHDAFIWDAEKGETVFRLPFLLSNRRLADYDPFSSQIALIGRDQDLYLYEQYDKNEIRLGALSRVYGHALFFDNGKKVLGIGADQGTFESIVDCFDIATGELLWSDAGFFVTKTYPIGRSGYLVRVDLWNQSRDEVVAVRLIDGQNGEVVDSIDRVSYTGRGNMTVLTTAVPNLYLVRNLDRTIEVDLEAKTLNWIQGSSPIEGYYFPYSPNGEYKASVYSEPVEVEQVANNHVQRPLGRGRVASVQFVKKNGEFIVVFASGEVIAIEDDDLSRETVLMQSPLLGEATSVEISSADGSILANVLGEYRLFNPYENDIDGTLAPWMSYSYRMPRLVGESGLAFLLAPLNSELRSLLLEVSTGKVVLDLEDFGGTDAGAWISDSGKYFAIAEYSDDWDENRLQDLSVYEVSTRQKVASLEGLNRIEEVCFFANEEKIAIVDQLTSSWEFNSLRVIDISTHSVVANHDIPNRDTLTTPHLLKPIGSSDSIMVFTKADNLYILDTINGDLSPVKIMRKLGYSQDVFILRGVEVVASTSSYAFCDGFGRLELGKFEDSDLTTVIAQPIAKDRFRLTVDKGDELGFYRIAKSEADMLFIDDEEPVLGGRLEVSVKGERLSFFKVLKSEP